MVNQPPLKRPPASIYEQEESHERRGRQAADAIAEAELRRCEARMVRILNAIDELNLMAEAERSDATRLMAHLERSRRIA